MITLQFTTKPLPFAWLIRTATWSRISHVDFVLPDGRLLGARGSGGVAIREPGEYSHCERFHVEAPADVLKLAASQIGKPYDWAGILGFATRQNWQSEDKWFCSELVAWAFQEAGFPLLRAERASRITPRDLLLSNRLFRLSPQ